MSELKARRAYFSEDDYERGTHKICAKVSDCGYDRKNDWWSYAFEDEVYIKSEADKVIADLEESHKKEVGQLLMEIAELKKERNWLAKDRSQAYDDLEKRAQLNIKQEESNRHQKFKRCLAMAMWCRLKRLDAADYRIPREKWEFYDKWNKRWLELAEKFKEAK